MYISQSIAILGLSILIADNMYRKTAGTFEAVSERIDRELFKKATTWTYFLTACQENSTKLHGFTMLTTGLLFSMDDRFSLNAYNAFIIYSMVFTSLICGRASCIRYNVKKEEANIEYELLRNEWVKQNTASNSALLT